MEYGLANTSECLRTAGKVLPDMELVWEDHLTSCVTDENDGTAATPSDTISERVHGESQKTSRIS